MISTAAAAGGPGCPAAPVFFSSLEQLRCAPFARGFHRSADVRGVYLPRHHGEAEAAEGPGEPAEAPRAEQGETVLVAEDEPTVRTLVTEVLGGLGYIAIEAADGLAGLKVLQSNARIDLLVTDVGLPRMNGRQLADAGRVSRPGPKMLFNHGVCGECRAEPRPS